MSDKKSILKEAITEYEEIVKAANASAAARLSKDFPEKFGKYLKEELNKNKTEESEHSDNKKESKILDEGDNKKTDEKMKTEKKETLKVDENLDKKDGDVKKDSLNEKKDAVSESRFDDYSPEGDEQKEIDSEEIDATTKELNLNLSSDEEKVAEMPPGEKEDSEFQPHEFRFEDIEREIEKMEMVEKEIDERDDSVAHKDSVSFIDDGKGGIAFHQLVKLKNVIDEILNKADDGDTANLEEKKDDVSLGDDDLSLCEDDFITNDDLDRVLDDSDIDEHHGITHSVRKKVTGKLPRKGQGLPKSHEPQLRYAMQEMEKKLKNLIETNKKTTKSLNEKRKKSEVLSKLVEGYKGVLEKYRDQLKSMSVFNTNLAHVNNLLVNESLALTQKEKVKIISEFKEVGSIDESEKKYKELLSEMGEKNKKRINENLDEKLSKSNSIQPSSKKVLDDVIEKTAYASNNEHIQNIKRINEYLDKRGSKKRI